MATFALVRESPTVPTTFGDQISEMICSGRRALRLLPHRDRLMTAAIASLVLGMVVLMAMCVVPTDDRFIQLLVGVPALWASRILLEVRARRLTKA